MWIEVSTFCGPYYLLGGQSVASRTFILQKPWVEVPLCFQRYDAGLVDLLCFQRDDAGLLCSTHSDPDKGGSNGGRNRNPPKLIFV